MTHSEALKVKSIEDALSLIGVSFDVSRADLRNAYHSRMKEVHPDATHDSKTNRGKEVTDLAEAYNFLLEHLFNQHKNQKKSGRYHLYMDIREMSSGTILVDPVGICDDCNGTGFLRPIKCSECNGSGHVSVTLHTPHGDKTRSAMCASCHGAGEIKVPCAACVGGKRRFPGKVIIPTGTRPGDILKVDVYKIIIGLKKNNGIAIDGDVYVMDYLAPFSRMVLGGKITVSSPAGNEVSILLPENCKPGRKFTVRNEGVVTKTGARGDLCVRVGVQMLSQKQCRNHVVRFALKLLQKYGI